MRYTTQVQSYHVEEYVFLFILFYNMCAFCTVLCRCTLLFTTACNLCNSCICCICAVRYIHINTKDVLCTLVRCIIFFVERSVKYAVHCFLVYVTVCSCLLHVVLLLNFTYDVLGTVFRMLFIITVFILMYAHA